MKIESIDIYTTLYIETDDEEYPYWRRNAKNSWENLMGESWECMEPPEGLKELVQDFILERMKNL